MERSNTPMLSRPRNPPEKRLLPSMSLRFTPCEVDDQLLKPRRRGSCGRAGRARRPSYRRASRPGMDGRIDIRKVELVSGQLAVRVHVPFAQEKHELLLGKIRVQPRDGKQWNARCQAAYQGYSHLSGMEMTSRL